MSRASDPFVTHVLELLSGLGPCRARPMFGGYGIYLGERMIGLIAWERLYLKTDAQTRQAFSAAGGEPFVHEAKGRPITMAYLEPPSEALDDAELMRPWARLALEAALRAPSGKRVRGR